MIQYLIDNEDIFAAHNITVLEAAGLHSGAELRLKEYTWADKSGVDIDDTNVRTNTLEYTLKCICQCATKQQLIDSMMAFDRVFYHKPVSVLSVRGDYRMAWLVKKSGKITGSKPQVSTNGYAFVFDLNLTDINPMAQRWITHTTFTELTIDNYEVTEPIKVYWGDGASAIITQGTVSNTYGNDNSNKEIDVIADTDGSIVFIPWYGTIQYFIISSDGLLLVEFYTNYIIKHTLAIPFDLLSTTHKAVLPNINQLFTKYNPLSYITPNGLYYFRYIDISESPVTMWSTVTPGRIVNRILSDNGYGVYSLSAPFNYNESPLYPYLITNNIPDHTYSIRISNNGEHMYILRNPNNDVWFLEHYKLNPTQPFMVHFEWLQTSVNLNEFLYPGVSGSKIIHCELCVNPTGSELNLFLFSADSNNVVIDPSCIKRIPLNNYNIADINRVNIVTTPLKYRPVQNTGNKIFYLHSGNIEHIDIAPFDPPAETAEDILFNSKKLNDRTFVAVMDASFTLELGIKWSHGTGYYINIEFNGVVEPVLINADTTIIRNYNVTELSSLRISTSTISGNMEQSTYAITSIELVNAGVSRVFAKFPQPDPADKDMSLATLNLSGNKLNYASIDTIMDTIKPVSDIAYHAMLNIDLSGGTSQPPSYDTWEHIQTLKNNGATINHN